MYVAKYKDEGVLEAGGRKSDYGKVHMMKALSNNLVVVYRVGKPFRVYANKRVNRMLRGQ